MNRVLILFLCLGVLTAAFYASQQVPVIKTEGLYPVVRAPHRVSFTFEEDAVQISLQDNASAERIAVFAYDADQRQVVIVKPVEDGSKITIRSGDAADYRVSLEEGAVKDVEIFREIPGLRTGVDFFRLLVEAKAASRRYGVQDCLYPICTRCMDVCPVIRQGVIKMKIDESGAFFPAIHITACPRSGKCFAVCPLGAIVSVSQAAKDNLRTRQAE